MSIPVQRYKRKKIMGDQNSPELFYLKPVAGHSRSYNIDDVAAETELVGALSAEDVVHVMKSFIRSLRKILVRGDKVKIEGLGLFHTTFNCIGSEEEKDCTVKNIRKVNVRFSVDNTLRLVNESIATTRGGDNNVQYYIKGETSTSSGSGDDGGDDTGGYVDPTT